MSDMPKNRVITGYHYIRADIAEAELRRARNATKELEAEVTRLRNVVLEEAAKVAKETGSNAGCSEGEWIVTDMIVDAIRAMKETDDE